MSHTVGQDITINDGISDILITKKNALEILTGVSSESIGYTTRNYYNDPQFDGNTLFDPADIFSFLTFLSTTVIPYHMDRIQQIRFTGQFGQIPMRGVLLTALGENNFDPSNLEAYTHELIHIASDPTYPCVISPYLPEDNKQTALLSNGTNLELSLTRTNSWLRVMKDIPDFFHEYFFDLEFSLPDGTPEENIMRTYLSQGRLPYVFNEIIAIATNKYLWDQRDYFPSLTQMQTQYPELDTIIRQQLALTRFGSNALVNRPLGHNDAEIQGYRKLILFTYFNQLRSRLTASTKNVLTSLIQNNNLLRYYQSPDKLSTNHVTVEGNQISWPSSMDKFDKALLASFAKGLKLLAPKAWPDGDMTSDFK